MIRTSCFLAASLALTSSPAAAKESVDPFALSLEQLFDAEVISASRTLESIWDAPAAVYLVSAADIERAGATSIPEALRLVPGVQVARINSSGWAVSVRGFNSSLANKLLVLIDGREIYDPLFSGVYWDVQDTALEDVDRIELIRGPGASLWGANAVNGVINIITRPASQTQGALASFVAGEAEGGGVTVRYGGSRGEAAHWRIYGRAFDRVGQKTLAGADDNSGWNAWRGGFRFDVDASARDSFTLQGDLYHVDAGQLRAEPTLSAPYSRLQNESIESNGGNLLARWTRESEQGGRFTGQAYLDVTRRDQLPLEDHRTTFDIDSQYEFPLLAERHTLLVGLRYRTTTDKIAQTAIITSATSMHKGQLISAFAQDQIALGKSWRLTVGSKVDDTEYTGMEVQPNARLQWADKNDMVWASISRAVRSPSELEREFNVVTGVVPPNPAIPVPVSVELRPSPAFESEQLVAYELGYRRRWSAVELDVAAFHNEYEGLETLVLQAPQLLFNPLHFVLPIAATNLTNATTDGIETTVSWHARENLKISLNYTFLSMALHGPSASVAIAAEAAETQSPRNQANLRLQWDASDRLAIDSTFYYVDEIPAFQVESYVRADLRVGYRFSEALQFEVIGQNLLDEGHREFGSPTDANAASIQRSVFGRLTWRR